MSKDGIENPIVSCVEHCKLYGIVPWAALCPVEPFAECNFMPCGELCPGNIFTAEHCASGSLCPVLWSVLFSVTLCHVEHFLPEIIIC